jgi:hypothetical protein
MLILAIHQTPSLTRERYEEVVRRLTGKTRIEAPSDLPFDGLLVHAAGQGPNGFCVFDVFESEEAIEAFRDARHNPGRSRDRKASPLLPGPHGDGYSDRTRVAPSCNSSSLGRNGSEHWSEQGTAIQVAMRFHGLDLKPAICSLLKLRHARPGNEEER